LHTPGKLIKCCPLEAAIIPGGASMIVIPEEAIRKSIDYRRIIPLMREALMAQSRGECDTPMPMHLDIPGESAEVHIKSSYRSGGRYFVLKVASTFPMNRQRGLSSGNGLMLLCSAETGEPAAMLIDGGHLTDVRTAAVAAMVTAELKREDTRFGIIGSGIQARLQAALHARILDLQEVFVWGRTAESLMQCCRDIQDMLPQGRVHRCSSPAEVASRTRLIAGCTASREPLLHPEDLQSGTLLLAVGSDAPGKQELHSSVLQAASLLLVDSRAQCARLGELQHCRDETARSIEIGEFCQVSHRGPRDGITVCDMTGLGVEDLFIAEHSLNAHRGIVAADRQES
jgi:ornithine cyclodeaminase